MITIYKIKNLQLVLNYLDKSIIKKYYLEIREYLV